MKAKHFCLLAALTASTLVASRVMASLIGLSLDFPLLTFNNTGVLSYSVGTRVLSIDAQPIAIMLSPADTPITIFATGGGQKEFSIQVEADASGELIGGVPGDDLVVTGEVDLGVLGIFSGVLLTGEVLDFGAQDSGGPTDFFDFRFDITGGALAFLYDGQGTGVNVTSEGSSFVGDFAVNFNGGSKGNLGGTPNVSGCRFTGGGVDTDLNWDHTLESGEMIRNGAGHLPTGIDRYQFGGQAGAHTALPPQPSGEWTHHQQTGPSGSFTFHGGTSSAPAGTEIDEIRCSDPGFCFPARPAPTKQLDFDGVGTFKNIGNGKKAPTWEIPNATVTGEGKGNKDFDGTFHWFEVNIDDLGERGGFNVGAPNSAICPGLGFGEKSGGLYIPDNGPQVLLPETPLADCDCPDFYRITIYDGVDASDVVFLPDGSIDPNSLDRTSVIYEAFGYIDGGNLQIHPLTGFDQ